MMILAGNMLGTLIQVLHQVRMLPGPEEQPNREVMCIPPTYSKECRCHRRGLSIPCDVDLETTHVR